MVVQSAKNRIVIKEKIYPQGSTKLAYQKVTLAFKGEAFVINLDKSLV